MADIGICPLCKKDVVKSAATAVGSGAATKHLHPECFEWLRQEKLKRKTSVDDNVGGRTSVSDSGPLVESAAVKSEWVGASAGGGYSNVTFANNPQFTLNMPDAGSVEICVEQHGVVGAPLPVGVQVCDRDGELVARVKQRDILQNTLQRSVKMSITLELTGPKIYTLVPHTLSPGQQAKFTISVRRVSGSSFRFAAWEPRQAQTFALHTSVSGEWTESSAGGSINCLTCNRNPQWFLKLPAGCGEQAISVVLEQEVQAVPPLPLRHLSVYILDKNGARFNEQVVLQEEILGSSGDYQPEKRVAWAGRLRGRAQSYLLLPTTFEPKEAGRFKLHVYSHVAVSLEAAPEFGDEGAEYGNKIAISAAWAGLTAGGCCNHETFVNNPQFYLSTGSKPVAVEIVLTQDPPEPAAAGAAAGGAAAGGGMPAASLQHIGLSIGRSYDEIKRGRPLMDTGSFVNAAAVSLRIQLEPSITPYCVIASTFLPGAEASFVIRFESDAVLRVTPSIPDLDSAFSCVRTWTSGWRPQSAAGDVGYYDNPQLALHVAEQTDVALTLIQAPPLGMPYLELALIVCENGGRRVVHNGFTMLADSGSYVGRREVVVTASLAPSRTGYTVFPTNLQPGTECAFTVIVRSSAPLELEPLADLSPEEASRILISELDTDRKIYAMSSLSQRVDGRTAVDERIQERQRLARLGLGSSLERMSKTHTLPAEMRSLIVNYEEEAIADNDDPSSAINQARDAARSPVWSVTLVVPHAGGAPVVLDLDSNQLVSAIVSYLASRFPLPVGALPVDFALFVPDPLDGLMALEDSAPLRTERRILTQGLAVTFKPVDVRVRAPNAASAAQDLKVDATATARDAVRVVAKALGLNPIEYGLLQSADPSVRSEGPGARWLDDGETLTAHAHQPAGSPLADTPLLMLKRPHPLTVEVQFFERIVVNLRLQYSTTVRDAKAAVLAAPELTGHVVPTLFATHALFANVDRGKPRMLDEGRSLADEGLVPPATVLLMIRPDADDSAEGGVTTAAIANKKAPPPKPARAGAGGAAAAAAGAAVVGGVVVAGAAAAAAGSSSGGGAAAAAGASAAAVAGASDQPSGTPSLRPGLNPAALGIPGYFKRSADDAGYVTVWEEPVPSSANLRTEIVEGKTCLSAASLNMSMHKLVISLDQDLEFQETFLLTYESFASASEVMDKLIECYNVPPQSSLRGAYAALSADKFEKTVAIPVRHQVLSIVVAWAQYFSKYMALEDQMRLELTAAAVDAKGTMLPFVRGCLCIAERATEEVKETSDKLLLRIKCGSASRVLTFARSSLVGDGRAPAGRKFELAAGASDGYQFSCATDGVLDNALPWSAYPSLSNLSEVFFKAGTLEVGEWEISEDEKLYYRVQVPDGSSKMMTFSKTMAVRDTKAMIAKKLKVPGADAAAESHDLSCEEYGVLDDDQALQTYLLKSKSLLYFSPKGDGPATKKSSVVLRIVCDDKTAKEVVFQSTQRVSDCLNHIGVTMGILEVSQYELKCVAYGRLHLSHTLGSYSLAARTEVYFTRRNTSDDSIDGCVNYTLIRPRIAASDDRVPRAKVPKRRSHLLTIWDLEEQETARQLTLMDHEAYAAIESIELLDQAWTKAKYAYRCANLLAFIHRFNRIACWVAHTILEEPKVRRRAQIMKFHIGLATELRRLNNYHALMAVLGGLGNPAVGRLKWTKARLGKSSVTTLEALEALMSMKQGYTKYRTALAESQFCVPYIGLYLTDLIFIEDGNQNTVDGLIHWFKWRLLRTAISKVRSFQGSRYSLEPVESLQTYLNSQKIADDKTLFDMSMTLEPRGADRTQIE